MDASPFARLPAELRDTIWTYALRASFSIGFRADIPPSSRLPQRRMLALTETCKSIRVETRPLFFKINTFAFQNILDTLDGDFDTFTASIGADAIASLRSLTFGIYNLGRKNTKTVPESCSPEVLAALCRFCRFALEHPRCDCALRYRPIPVLEMAVIDLYEVSTSATAVVAKLRASTAESSRQARLIEFAARVVERWRDVLEPI